MPTARVVYTAAEVAHRLQANDWRALATDEPGDLFDGNVAIQTGSTLCEYSVQVGDGYLVLCRWNGETMYDIATVTHPHEVSAALEREFHPR